MAKYSVKFEIEVVVDEDFEIGEVDEVLYGEGIDAITSARWNDIVCDAIKNMDTDDLSGNVTEIARVWEEEKDFEGDEEEIQRLAEMREELDRSEVPWDYGKHFE